MGPSTYVDTELNNLKITKEVASFIDKLTEKDSTRNKKKESRKTEDGIVRRLAKNGLIDKNKVKAARTSSTKTNKKTKKG